MRYAERRAGVRPGWEATGGSMFDASDTSAKGKRLNWRQACEIMGCGKTRFYRLVRSGALVAYNLQGAQRGLWVYEHDCRELVQRTQTCPENEAKT